MITWLKNIKIRRQKRKHMEDFKVQLEFEAGEREVASATALMLSSPCAIKGFTNCSSACVHFKTGKTFITTAFDRETLVLRCFPSCKLWK